MRLMLKFTIPVEKGNRAAADGTLENAIAGLIEQVKPEAAYFMLEGGKRAGLVVFEADDQATMPGINEPLFAALDAAIEIQPVLTADDLERGFG